MDLKETVKKEIDEMVKHDLNVKFHYNKMEFDNDKLGNIAVEVFIKISKI